MKQTLNKYAFWHSAMLSALLVFSASALAQTNPAEENPPTNASLYAAQSAEAWLAKMSDALQRLNFEASFVVLKPGVEAQPYLWRHGTTEDGIEMEQLNLLNGPGREVLRVNDVVSYFEPNVPPYSLNSTVINGPMPVAFFDDPLRLDQAYEFITVGRGRIAGRAAQQIRIVSRDKSRFGYNLWVDQDTGLPLKLNTMDLQGQTLEQIQITQLNVTESLPEYFNRIEQAKLPKVVSLPSSGESRKNWKIDYLPKGMTMLKWDLHRLPVTGHVVEYVMLSDGLVDVSVYLQRAEGSAAGSDMLLRHEATTFLSRRQGQVQVTVIGKLPAQTANAIASSITLVN